MSALISTQELAQKIETRDLRLLDASWHMPAENRNAATEYAQAHIPGAVFFDIDAICDRDSPYPHMLPTPEAFAESVSTLGIGNDADIVVYDANGLFSAARVWWMFRVFGHERIRMLDGGLPQWRAEGRTLASGAPIAPPAVFYSHKNEALVRNRQQVAANILSKQERLIDARSPGRFNGSEPEPRPGLAGGHIAGSANVFFRECLLPPYNTLKEPQALRALFAAAGIDTQAPIVATCGSGVTACILALALHELGNKNVAVYDGAWAEWGALSPF